MKLLINYQADGIYNNIYWLTEDQNPKICSCLIKFLMQVRDVDSSLCDLDSTPVIVLLTWLGKT